MRATRAVGAKQAGVERGRGGVGRARGWAFAEGGGWSRAELGWAAGCYWAKNREKPGWVLERVLGWVWFSFSIIFLSSFLFLIQTKFEFKYKFEFKPHSNI